MFRIDRVFRAPEGDDVNFLHSREILFCFAAEKGVHELLAVEHLELVDTFADADVADGNAELVADADHHAALGRAVEPW